MDWVWTWGGKSFGYIDNVSLRTHYGKHIGKLYGEEIYGTDGHYLGEIKSKNRLITNISKKNWNKGSFTPYIDNVGSVPYVDYVGYVMYAGYEDFPSPKSFK